MRIHVKLMGGLRNRLPAGSTAGKAELEVEANASSAKVLERLGIAAAQVHLVMVNGAIEHDRHRPLTEGDEVVIFPPVAGG